MSASLAWNDGEIWDNKSGPEGAINTIRSLIHSLDLTKEESSVNPTPNLFKVTTCKPWQGRTNAYQRAAHERFAAADNAHSISPWSWIATECGTPTCMIVGHMRVHSPVRIAYEPGVCVYCGVPAGTMDHLLPRAWTGDSGQRASVALVPACGNCNSRISDAFAISVTERRRIAHASIRKTHAGLLAVPDRKAWELKEYGHAMRTVITINIQKRIYVRARLAWPNDPHYDLRAFQKSGIERPEELGLI